MDLRHVLTVILRRWWLVVGVPLVVIFLSLVFASAQPYAGTIRASVLIPGDTEDPGSSERPELMVLDDLPQMIGSTAFALAVDERLAQTHPELDLDPDEIQASLSGTRYSRILTVRAIRDDEGEALALIEAVRDVLPDQVNRFLVAPSAQPATVRFLENPSVERGSNDSEQVVLAVEGIVALAIGCGLAALAGALDERLYTVDEVAKTLGLPILGDVQGVVASAEPIAGEIRGDRAA
jgi:capsular polysaccharide biosynthesis protein